MLRLFCRHATFILMFSIGKKAVKIDTGKYIPFLSDVQDYYKSSGIFILYDDASEKFEVQRNTAAFNRHLSQLGILSQALRYSKFSNRSDLYLERNVQSLFVALFTSSANVDHFSEVSAIHDMSYHTWLIIFTEFLGDGRCHASVGNPFHLVFNTRMLVMCDGERAITKWYSLFTNRTEVLQLASWSRESGISYVNKNYYASRFDLAGTEIRVATHSRKTLATNAKMTGYFETILAELQNFMNFKVVRAHESDASGHLDSGTGKWSGLVGLLTEGQVDLVVAPITLSKLRLRYIDFTIPLILSANRIYVKQPAGAMVQWSAYFRAYTVASWLSIAAILIGSSLLAAFIKMRTVGNFNSRRLSCNYFLENFMQVWGIFCQQGASEFSSVTPLRLVYFAMLLMTLILWAIYSASITSYLTFLSPSLPFSDTDGFVKDGSYKLIVLQNSSDYQIIMSETDPVLTALKPLLKNTQELPTNPYDGFQQVCEERIGFYASDAIFKGISGHLPCTLTYIETGQFECLAMAMPKRTPYITSINYNLRKLKDNGMLKKLHYWYFRQLDQAQENSHSPIGIWGIAPLLAIFASGFVLSLFILLLEQFSR
ncbi:glutamate receptor ionotropic, kainate 2-like [Phymastichus coffea]|uniref:glutamate receptor ionotropic, kainate 2-like n=1 Tax=Phymastichus coffea TaxID=108790 RepID=UPI00273B113D|nr:glutamate receptor ionotropic, kainate 2-like [Phymastichus coffea]